MGIIHRFRRGLNEIKKQAEKTGESVNPYYPHTMEEFLDTLEYKVKTETNDNGEVLHTIYVRGYVIGNSYYPNWNRVGVDTSEKGLENMIKEDKENRIKYWNAYNTQKITTKIIKANEI